MKLTFVLVILLGIGPDVTASPDQYKCPELDQAVSLCAVLANATQYDGKEITVRGLYHMVIHGSVLSARDCFQPSVNLRNGTGYKVSKRAAAIERALTKKDRFHEVDEVLRGVFRVAEKEQCFGQVCSPYEIEVAELLCAQPPPPKMPPTH